MRRVVSLISIFISILALSFVLCLLGDVYPDEWICMGFLDIIFYMLLLFELEYERNTLQLSNNSRTDYLRFTFAFIICSVVCIISGFMPLYSRPVMIFPILLCLIGNEFLAFISGTYFCILLSITVSGDFFELVCELLLVITGAILAKMLKEDKLQICIYLITISMSIVTPGIFYYMSTKEFSVSVIIAGAVSGMIVSLIGIICARVFKPLSADETNDRLIAIIEEDFPAVKQLKKHNFSEYNHGNFVSTIAIKAAKQKHKSVMEGVEQALAMHFPEKLTNILYEYYGKLRHPQTPESALIHMVDALIVRLDHIKNDVADSEWNHEILIIQTLNELSSSGMYDESGLSMNHFLKIRDYLTKEELLK